jgi:hypothetical protein
MVTKQELIDQLHEQDVIFCALTSDDSFSIGTATYWLGGNEGRFMCDFIGNIEYNTIEACVNALFAFLDKEGLEIEETDF